MTFIALLTEAQARADVTIARRLMSRAQRKLASVGHKGGAGNTILRIPPSVEWCLAEAEADRRASEYDASLKRLDAVLSQQPDRGMGAWA